MRISDWSSDVCSSDLPTSNPCRAPEGRDRNLIRRREGEMAVWRRLFRFAVCNLYQDQQSIRTNCGLRGRKVTRGLPMSGNLAQITPFRDSIRRGVMTKPAETVQLMLRRSEALVTGKSASFRGELGGRSIIKKKK